MYSILLKFLIIGIGLVVGILYSFALLNYPSLVPQGSIPVTEQQPIQTEQDENEILQLQPDDTLAVKLPADENTTISTEIAGAGGIAGVGKPSVVNITSGNNSD